MSQARNNAVRLTSFTPWPTIWATCMRTLALPEGGGALVDDDVAQQALVKIGAKVDPTWPLRIQFQLAEVAVPRDLFRKILSDCPIVRRNPLGGVGEGIDGEEKATGEVCLDGEKNDLQRWPSKRGPITKIMPSDGCIGDTVPLAVGKWYDFHEFGWYMGNVGSMKL